MSSKNLTLKNFFIAQSLISIFLFLASVCIFKIMKQIYVQSWKKTQDYCAESCCE